MTTIQKTQQAVRTAAPVDGQVLKNVGAAEVAQALSRSSGFRSEGNATGLTKTQVQVTGTQLGTILRNQHLQFAIQKQSAGYEFMVIDFARGLVTEYPQQSQEWYQGKINSYRGKVQTIWKQADGVGSNPTLKRVEQALLAAKEVGGFIPGPAGAVVQLGVGSIVQDVQDYDASLNTGRTVQAQIAKQAYIRDSAGAEGRKVRDLLQRVKSSNNPAAQAAVAASIFGAYNVPAAPTVAVQMANPAFAAHSQIGKIAQQQGEHQQQYTIDIKDIKSGLKGLAADVKASRAESKKSRAEIKGLITTGNKTASQILEAQHAFHVDQSGKTTELLGYARATEKRRLQAAKQAKFDQKIQVAHGVVDGVTQLMQLSPELKKHARKTAAIGHAAVSVYKIANTLATTALTSAGMALATGNLVGVGMTLAMAFMDKGPSVEQQMLEGLQEVQKQLHELRREMHQRFDVIDKKLDRMLDIMVKSFGKVIELAKSNQDYNVSILHEVVKMQQAIERVEGEQYSQFKALYGQSFKDLVGRCIAEGRPKSMRQWELCVSDFSTWADRHAKTLATGPNPGSPFQTISTSNRAVNRDLLDVALRGSDVHVLPTIDNISEAINPLLRFAKQVSGASLHLQKVSNLLAWDQSSNGQVLHASKNPPKNDAQRQQLLENLKITIKSGSAIEGQVKALQDPTVAKPLFKALLAEYQQNLQAAQNSYYQAGNAYLHDTSAGRINPKVRGNMFFGLFRNPVQPANPFNHTTRTPYWPSRLHSVHGKGANGVYQDMPVGSKMQDFIPPAYQWAEVLGLGKINMHWGYNGKDNINYKGGYYFTVPFTAVFDTKKRGYKLYQRKLRAGVTSSPTADASQFRSILLHHGGNALYSSLTMQPHDMRSQDMLIGEKAKQRTADYQEINGMVQKRMTKFRTEFAVHAARVLHGSARKVSPQDVAFKNAMTKLDKSKRLIQAYARLIFPHLAKTDLVLGSRIFGGLGLVGSDNFTSYAEALGTSNLAKSWGGKPAGYWNDTVTKVMSGIEKKLNDKVYVSQGVPIVGQRLQQLQSLQKDQQMAALLEKLESGTLDVENSQILDDMLH